MLQNNRHLIICSFYRLPDSDASYLTELCSIFREISNAYKNSLVWLVGDLNLRSIDWNHYSSSSSLSNIFLDFTLEFGFNQIVDFPNRGQNTLDVFLTNHPSYEYTCQPLTGISDREIICLISAVDVDLHQAVHKKIYLWQRVDFDDIRAIANNLSEEFLNEFDTDIPIELLWSEFKIICKKCLDQIPTKLFAKCPREPWINSRIK